MFLGGVCCREVSWISRCPPPRLCHVAASAAAAWTAAVGGRGLFRGEGGGGGGVSPDHSRNISPINTMGARVRKPCSWGTPPPPSPPPPPLRVSGNGCVGTLRWGFVARAWKGEPERLHGDCGAPVTEVPLPWAHQCASRTATRPVAPGAAVSPCLRTCRRRPSLSPPTRAPPPTPPPFPSPGVAGAGTTAAPRQRPASSSPPSPPIERRSPRAAVTPPSPSPGQRHPPLLPGRG